MNINFVILLVEEKQKCQQIYLAIARTDNGEKLLDRMESIKLLSNQFSNSLDIFEKLSSGY